MARLRFAPGLAAVAVVVGLAFAAEKQASACGGCVVPPNQTASDITDERMLLSVSPQQTTLYDQIRYAGSPESFAWVLPISGTVDVGLSADVLFGSIDSLTATRINPPPVSCPGLPAECFTGDSSSAPSASEGSSGGSGGGTVTKEENVGPYATVQLKSTDPQALTKWLSDNGFQLKPEEIPIVQQYVAEGFDFLALKLLPNKDVKSMRPVRVTSYGASLSLPLRMAAVGTGAKVGITIWVVSDGKYQPQNFPFYKIEDKDLVWDFQSGASNYTSIRAQKDLEFAGKGWELQSSLSLDQQSVANTIRSGGVFVGGGPGGPQGTAGNDYLPIEAEGQNAGKTADEVRAADIKALFAGMNGPSVRVTRMRSDIAKTAMNVDFLLEASPDQSEISNVRNPTKYVNLQCPVYSNCQVVGYASTPEDAANQTSANSNTAEGFGCTTARSPRGSMARDIGLSAGLAALGAVVVRAARRRRATKD